MSAVARSPRTVMMLGTFGLRPKATLRSRALAIASTLSPQWSFELMTTPWDYPVDRGRRWNEGDVCVTNTRATHPALFPLVVAEMIRKTKRSTPTLVHLFKPKGFGDLAARWLNRVTPVVVDMDDWEGTGGWNDFGGYNRLQRSIFDWQERTWPKMAATITVASRELEQRAQALGAKPDEIFYVPNGLTRERFDTLSHEQTSVETFRHKFQLANKRPITLYTRFIEYEPSLIVQVISAVRTKVPDAVLFVIGASADGRAEQSAQASARQSGLHDAIIFHGWAESNEIPALLSAGEVAIHPFSDDLINRSKCSVKLLELMSAGLPVVSNSVGENAQMIEHGVSGLLAPPNDAEAMAQYVIELLGNTDRAADIGRAARQRVQRYYLWEHLAPQVTRAYERALAKRYLGKRR